MAEEVKSNRGLADILGVNESSIRRAEEKGRIAIKRDENGNVDVEDAKKQWQMAQNAGKGDVALTYQRSRASKEFYEFQIKKLEYEEMKGKLVDLATMEKEAYTAARVARDKLLCMPDRLGPHMLGKSDLQEVKDIIRKEVTAALDNLTDFFRKRVQSR